MPDMSKLLDLPTELVERVLFFRLYQGNEFFTDVIEYPNPEDNKLPLLRRHAKFARTILRANKSLYKLGLPLLWKFLPLRRTQDVVDLCWLTKRGVFMFRGPSLMNNVERVEYHIEGPYEPGRIPSLLGSMEKVKIIMVRPRTVQDGVFLRHGGYSHHDLMFSAVKPAHVQFDSLGERMSVYDLRSLLNKGAPLSTLRVVGVESTGTNPSWEGTRPLDEQRFLARLSIGDPDHPEGRRGEQEMLQSFLLMLAAEPVLPALATLHLFGDAGGGMNRFARLYGEQLESMVMTAPPWAAYRRAEYKSWPEECPNLRRLVWIEQDWGSGVEVMLLPAGHGKLERLTLSFRPGHYFMEADLVLHAQRLVERCVLGEYPELKDVRVNLMGESERVFGENGWIVGVQEGRKAKGFDPVDVHVDNYALTL
jgi:hypothetical protein